MRLRCCRFQDSIYPLHYPLRSPVEDPRSEGYNLTRDFGTLLFRSLFLLENFDLDPDELLSVGCIRYTWKQVSLLTQVKRPRMVQQWYDSGDSCHA